MKEPDWDESSVQEKNLEGKWVPAIPLPLYCFGILFQCSVCHAWFWTWRGYRGHFALAHVLKLRERGDNWVNTIEYRKIT